MHESLKYWSLKRSSNQLLKSWMAFSSSPHPDVLNISWCLESAGYFQHNWRHCYCLSKPLLKCNCSLLESRNCKFFFSVLVTEVADCSYQKCEHSCYDNFSVTCWCWSVLYASLFWIMWPLQRLLASTMWAGVQYMSGMKLTYFADCIPAAYKMAQVFLLIDFMWRGRVKLMPASSLKYVCFFFSLSNTSISFVYACVSPLFFLPIFVCCCFIFIIFFFRRPERTLCRLLMERT